jgi:Zn finger protein HypA/HybF involved in hydrogenase expression
VLKAILVVQLVAPLALGIPIWLWAKISSMRRERSQQRQGGRARVPERLAPLVCPKCSAPVPLQREEFPCPSCGATVTPPAEYVRMLELRARASAELARAERRWRWSRWTSSPLVGLVLGLASVAWFTAVVYAMIETGWGLGIDIVTLMTAGFLCAAGVVSAFNLVAARKALPALPAGQFMHPPAASATCKHCNAPIAFARDELAAICPYCGGDNYREALARLLQADASTQEQAASASLLDAVRELDDRRDMLFSIIGCAAIVELLYAALAIYGACSDWLNGP